MATVRYVADWINDMDDMGNTADDRSFHDTFDAAHKAALRGSKNAGAIEWVRVREQHYNKRIGMWETVRKWTGDYDVLEECT